MSVRPLLPRRGFLSWLNASGVAPFAARAYSYAMAGAVGPGIALAQAAKSPPAADFLFAPGVTYLNTGALGPTPQTVLERVHATSRALESNPSDEAYGPLKEQMETVKASAASFLNCDTDEISITDSTTNGMNAIALSLGLRPGDRVLTSDQEHNAAVGPGWSYLARKNGVIVDVVKIPQLMFDADEIVSRFVAKLTPRTRVLSVSHVTSTTGYVLPVARLAAALQGRNCLLVVDGAQSAGAIPVNVRELGCHAYATSGHKWLMGPKGTGLVFLSREAADKIEPVFLERGRGVQTDATGVRHIPSILGLGAALQSYMSWDKSAVERRAMNLRNFAYDELKQLKQVSVISPPPGEAAAPMVTFLLPDRLDSTAVKSELARKHGIVVKQFPRRTLNALRVSTHVFNHEDHIVRLVAALRQELS